MNTRETLRRYMTEKLRDMESARRDACREPAHVMLRDYHDAIMEEMRGELMEMADEGLVEMGPTLNSMWLRLKAEEEE